VRLVTEQRLPPAPGSGRITVRCHLNPTMASWVDFSWTITFFFFFLGFPKLNELNNSLWELEHSTHIALLACSTNIQICMEYLRIVLCHN